MGFAKRYFYKLKILINQAIIPSYRVPFFKALQDQYQGTLMITTGEYAYKKKDSTSSQIIDEVQKVRNIYLLKGNFLWQTGLLSFASKVDLLIIGNDYRYLTTWLSVFIRWIRRKPTILWGHINGRSRWGHLIRYLLVKGADGFITYTQQQKEKLQADFPQLPVWVASNGCLWASECAPIRPETALAVKDYIYVGRLIPEKKIGFLVQTFLKASQEGLLPEDAKLIIVGTGPEEKPIRELLEEYPLQASRVLLKGKITDPVQLRYLYARSLCSISPGYVGLSLTQTLAFGIPMLISEFEAHSPEIEAFKHGENGYFFKDERDLINKMVFMRTERKGWLQKRPNISAHIQKNYTFETMLSGFEEAIRFFSLKQ